MENWVNFKKYLVEHIRLSDISGNISSHTLSRCEKIIQEKVYKSEFIDFLSKTKALKAPSEIKFDTAIMALKQGYHEISKATALGEILSEGEQTVVVLAQFIVENKFNPDNHVLILDDPVNSLDLQRMGIIANNLIQLAKEKQIVIFTRNLVFFGWLKSAVGKDKLLKFYKFYVTEETQIDFKIYVGKITEKTNPNMETYKEYVSAINTTISAKETSAYSEDDIIDGHSSSLYAKVSPTISGFMEDFNSLKEIAKKFQ